MDPAWQEGAETKNANPTMNRAICCSFTKKRDFEQAGTRQPVRLFSERWPLQRGNADANCELRP
jgi:hypothetical protein